MGSQHLPPLRGAAEDKVTKYSCRSGTGQCDVSLANRRSCQACRYKKCIAAGMKPGLVLSDDQCSKRFGLKKDEPNPEAAPPKKPNESVENSENSSQVLENEYAVLIGSEKSASLLVLVAVFNSEFC